MQEIFTIMITYSGYTHHRSVFQWGPVISHNILCYVTWMTLREWRYMNDVIWMTFMNVTWMTFMNDVTWMTLTLRLTLRERRYVNDVTWMTLREWRYVNDVTWMTLRYMLFECGLTENLRNKRWKGNKRWIKVIKVMFYFKKPKKTFPVFP